MFTILVEMIVQMMMPSIPDLGDICDLPVVTVWIAGWGRGENGQDMTFEWDVIWG